MKKEMLINVLQQEECRIAIVEDGVLEELYVERASQESYVGNIYKGRIVNIEPSIQAAFVDFGIGRNGFLHVSDVDPAYYKHLLSPADLAAYEAEMDREYGGGGASRDRGGKGPRAERGPRPAPDRAPREMTSWLEPPPPAAPKPADEFVEDEGFGAGLAEGTPEPFADEAVEVEEVEAELLEAVEVEADVEEVEIEPAEAPPAPPVRPAPVRPAPAASDDEFGAGLTNGVEEVPPARAASKAPPRHRGEAKKPPAPPAPPAPRPPVEDDDFGAGIVDLAPPPVSAPATRPTADIPMADPAEPEPVGTDVALAAIEAGEPVAPEVPAAPAEEAPAAPKRRRKKSDGGSGDKPKPMPGAERRTSAGDDEGEIRPFFDDGGSADFDPDAPNDRFAPRPDEPNRDAEGSEPVERFSGDPEPAEAAEEEARAFAHEAEGAGAGDEPEVTGRGFNDDFDSGRPRPQGRGDRDRDRGRGGPRGGPRDRDRDRDRGRGGPRGGFKSAGGPKGGRDRGLPKPPIQEIFKRGQEVIVQVIKEAVGTKGPTLSTYVSIAGRYLVLMPSLNRVGVSRKIEDHDARRRLRDIMTTLAPPKGVGFIVRTAAVDRDARELQNDLAYLLRLWQVVVKRIKRVAGPVEIYRESDMITRTIRDIFTADIDTIWVDEPTAFAHASEFLQIVMPKFASRIKFFEHTEPLFHRYAIEDEIAKIYHKRIEMPLGGSLVIEQTEALVAIDVNSGNFRADNNAEETAFQMNLHAAKEIARQLRLRDLGGVIVNDFIDMRSESHRRKVEDAFRDALRRDRARTKILRISQFGLIEMTRQRIRPSLKRSIFADCPHCRGVGFVKTSESLSIEVMRLLQLAAHRAPAVQLVQVTVHPDAANYLLNKRRREIAGLEERGKLEVQVAGQVGVSPDTLLVRCFDHNGIEVRLLPPAPLPKLAAGRFPPGDRGRGGRDDRGPRGRDDRGSFPRPLD